ncbi:hypothetical protein [Ferrovibrio sp.]|uniref:hypothetical protein n=1 Tax=Ferrovibrio sp. TaxID=1917215 RepID=UPI000CC141CE|nr:hypothetical protein [Ferrovibrio sp.]PJI37566.1 MAG: hypothetical protein CTR53_19765 [Ferrovibrio sp.]
MISYRIDPARRLVLVTFTGTPSAADISTHQAELRRAPDFDPAYALLVDFSAASFANIQPADVRMHVMQDPFDPAAPHAIVVRQESDSSMVRMFETYSELSARTGPVQAFTDIPSALAWLDSLR